jgi:hypothetical protein
MGRPAQRPIQCYSDMLTIRGQVLLKEHDAGSWLLRYRVPDQVLPRVNVGRVAKGFRAYRKLSACLQRKLPSMPTKSRPSALEMLWWQDMQLDGASWK